MPEEIAILLVLILTGTFFLTFTKMILSHRRKVHEVKVRAKSSEGALTTSELEAMMVRSIENSMMGLHGKVEDLELEIAQLNTSARQLPEVDKASRLNLEDEVVEVERGRSASRRKV
ncbi:MAG: hypothetical protein HOC28_07165 [Bacteroidetes Order II. Incertae sedis bacterium]|nr:hypothetical protein [Bacteroidetes Order II. bacterium]MBT4602900.1 hypothetical protein [Bacteroidetes Order II. bacterium]MBT6200256.1 hypothetical protein [Bacteroidetes Order II. bacterium]MBT6424315.1 hypothetical protein [Bacteroidetes Order II. bacterium]MBT6581742.1 hypothetical protein [Bacteroidetes Order II. bacterium]